MNMELDEVVTIFVRIYQGGKRLSLFDLVHASVWSEDFDMRNKIAEFNNDPVIKIYICLIHNSSFTKDIDHNTKRTPLKFLLESVLSSIKLINSNQYSQNSFL